MPTVKKHAIFSPSAMAANMACIGKIAMEHGLPDTSSSYADEGTCAHFLGAYCLQSGFNAMDVFGDTVALWRDKTGKEGEGFKIDKPAGAEIYHSELVDEVFAGHVQKYVDVVRDYAQGHPILVEQKLSIAEITGEWYDDPDANSCCEGLANGEVCLVCGHVVTKAPATGTSDAVILLPDEIVVGDLKFGQGNEVSAVENEQEMTYALAAYNEFRGKKLSFTDNYQPKQIRLFISQPRITAAPSEWVCSVEELLEFGWQVGRDAEKAFEVLKYRQRGQDVTEYLRPNEVSCKYCKAAKAGICKAIDAAVREAIGVDFEDLTKESVEEHSRQVHDHAELGRKLKAVPLIETWIAGVRAAAERELIDNANSPEVCEKLGFKLVQGRRGNRQWKQDEKLERLLKRLLGAANCYTKKLISPADAEKALKGEKSWANVEKYITQPEGKPSVAPLADKREPLVLQTVADEFEDLTLNSGEDLI